MSIPAWIYFAMGTVIARIMLDGAQTQGYRLMDWFHLVFDISRIIVLWPLVLFVEKIEGWLKQEPRVAVMAVAGEKAGTVFEEHWQFEKPAPVTVQAGAVFETSGQMAAD